MVSNFYGIYTVFFVFRCINGEVDTKSNVAFVIDDTGSMGPVIDQVRDKAEEMFIAIHAAKNSLISEFILITFNDYEVYSNEYYHDDLTRDPIKVRAITKDPDVFLEKLNEINVGGGGLCPELCFGGIKSALEKCNPNSFIYVFTDASPKDHILQDTIINLAQQKSVQITFLLTDDTKCDLIDTGYKKIAAATSGEVFQLLKTDTNQILDYIIRCIQHQQTSVLTVPIEPGRTNINFTADKDMKDLSIKVNVKPKATVDLKVIGPEGNKTEGDDLINISNTKIIVIPKPRGGPYMATVNTNGTGETSIKATVSVDFKHGFSLWSPSSLENTRTRPVPGEKSYLTIQLILTGTIDAKVKSIQILDINNEELDSFPANVINKNENIYVTEAFKPPDHIFKIAVTVVDQNSNETFKRISRTPIKPQPLPTEEVKYKKPEVNIENRPKINVTFGESITLECKVKAYPKPTIVWEDIETTLELPSKVSIMELPDEYISHLKIDNVNKTGLYKCKATSIRDEVNTDSIEVAAIRLRFLKVLESPKDTKIDYEKDAKIYCKIDAWPTGGVAWFKDDKELIKDENFDISDDKVTLLVKKMRPELEGPYSCRATNDDNSLTMAFTLGLSGVDGPEINKTESSIIVNAGSTIDISCSILRGFPKPTIYWEFKGKDTNNFKSLSETEQVIHINNVSLNNAGIYTCVATNIVAKDTHQFLLKVHILPEIDHSKRTYIVKAGSKVTIPCRVIKGTPEPEISWKFRRMDTKEFINMTEVDPEVKIGAADLKNAGVYKCFAKNTVGEDSHENELIVQYVPVIDKSRKTQNATKGTKAVIACRILRGLPQPLFRWEFKRQSAIEFVSLPETKPDIYIALVKPDNSGIYKCYATNTVGEDSHEIAFTVHNAPTAIVNEPVIIKIGETVTLSCEVAGVPKPDVTWIRAGTNIEASEKYKIFNDNSLRFIATVDDGGNYTCYATNSFGIDSKNATLNVYGPVKIEPPEETVLYVDVGSDVQLSCKASGIPKPLIAWKFYSSNPNTESKIFPSTEQLLEINRIQANGIGYYTCVAHNSYDEMTLTYEVLVNVPVEIERPQQKHFAVVEHDIVLKIPCKAKGYPKPKVSWTKDFVSITTDYLYSLDPDDTLVIQNPNKLTAGKYLCIADNNVTAAIQMFTVNFTPIPTPSEPTETIYIEEGTSTEIECKLPHTSADVIRWYTDGKEININRFILRHAIVSNSGVYSCRMSSFQGSQSAHFRIIVGTKPYFKYKKDNEIVVAFRHGGKSFLDCSASGKPLPTVTWWHNGMKLNESSPIYKIREIVESDLGEYRCEAKNAFGIITRKYVFKITGCKINYAEKVKNKFHPVLISEEGDLVKFENEDGIIIVPEKQTFDILCPNNVRKVYCIKDEYIITDNTLPAESRYFKYEDLKCNSNVEPSTQPYPRLNTPCSHDRESRLIQVGYSYGGSFCAVYDVCLNQRTQRQYFIKYDVTRYASNIKIDSHPFVNRYMYYNYDSMYDCDKQNNIVGKGCCFIGRQLVTPQDVSPGVQRTTYFNMNVAPYWNFCGDNLNLNEIESRIRKLAKSTPYKLQVFSGVLQHQHFYLNDFNGNRKVIPKYLWKMVQIRERNQGLAIITINVPNLTPEGAQGLVFCRNLCRYTDWMRNTEWFNVRRGYTFCCSPEEFAKKNTLFQEFLPMNILFKKGKNE